MINRRAFFRNMTLTLSMSKLPFDIWRILRWKCSAVDAGKWFQSRHRKVAELSECKVKSQKEPRLTTKNHKQSQKDWQQRNGETDLWALTLNFSHKNRNEENFMKPKKCVLTQTVLAHIHLRRKNTLVMLWNYNCSARRIVKKFHIAKSRVINWQKKAWKDSKVHRSKTVKALYHLTCRRDATDI